MQAGVCVPIPHHIWGLYRQTRIARIRAYRKYFVAWGEFQEHGLDRFPHSQSFTVVPVDDESCLVVNRLRGQFRIPGARYWFLPLYRQLAPRILDYENRRIAAAVTTWHITKEARHGQVQGGHAPAPVSRARGGFDHRKRWRAGGHND